MLTKSELRETVSPLLIYIDEMWEKLTSNARDGNLESFVSWRELAASSKDGHLDDTDHENPCILYLPNDFVFPGGRFITQFYWDSYFIILALLRANRFQLAKGIVENCLHLVKKHGMVIANRKRWAAGSQLPFLSEMIKEVYQASHDLDWLATVLPVLEHEYREYWQNREHLVENSLSRYHAPPCFPPDRIPEITLDNEATWDLTPRFDAEDILDLVPVDLNSNLFGYETNFSWFHRELNNTEKSAEWRNRAHDRLCAMNSCFWDESEGLFYDWNLVTRTKKHVKSLATFFPLFHGAASAAQAKKVISQISLFERQYGLVTCDHDYGYTDRQWNWPIGWAPLHWIVYRALNIYGYRDLAERIALKWLTLNWKIWKSTGDLYEKYDVERGSEKVLTDRYVNQRGFAWTNAVFMLMVHDLCR